MKDVTAKEVHEFLHLLNLMSARQRNHFLHTLNKKQMRIMEVAFFNLATNHIGLSKADEKLLSKYKRPIEAIASRNFSHTEKRKILNQKGGLLPALLPILGTLVTSFLTS